VQTEPIIFIRPRIIRDRTDAHTLVEELRSKLRGTVKPIRETAPHVQRVQ
jgi:general secretion pathway protein D